MLAGSAQKQRTRAYTPGARVVPEEGKGKAVSEPQPKKRRKAVIKRSMTERATFPGCCTDVLEPILRIMVQRHEGLSVIKLSMVNKWFHQEISQNVEVWRELYLQWRGPLSAIPRPPVHGLHVGRLRPTIPRSLPNFREKPPRIA